MAITPFKITDFGTNRKPIYDFLLVINTNLPPVLHRFQIMADYVKFSLATGGRFALTPSLIPCEYRYTL